MHQRTLISSKRQLDAVAVVVSFVIIIVVVVSVVTIVVVVAVSVIVINVVVGKKAATTFSLFLCQRIYLLSQSLKVFRENSILSPRDLQLCFRCLTS